MPLAGEHLALLVLALDRAGRTGVVGLLAALAEVVELVVHRVAHCATLLRPRSASMARVHVSFELERRP